MMQQPNILNLLKVTIEGTRNKSRCMDRNAQLARRNDGATVSDRFGTEDFRNVYRSVARENREAFQTVENHGRFDDKEVEVRRDDNAVHAQAGSMKECIEKHAAEETRKIPKESDTAEDATDMIRTSLEVVSEALDLELAQDLDKLEISAPSESIVNQLSEMVHILRQIALLLADAGENNQSVEIKGTTLDPAQALQTEQVVRTQLLHIEFAFAKLGISKDVAMKVAEFENRPMDVGLLQAANPDKVDMPADQIRQFFSTYIASREAAMKNLLQNIAASAIVSEEEMKNAAKSMADLSNLVKQTDVGTFDTMVMRKMLKLDGKDSQGSDRMAFSADTVMPKPDVLKNVRSWNLTFLQTSVKEMSLSDQGTLPVTEIAGKSQAMNTLTNLLGPKMSQTLMRNIEETVMKQIVEKMNTVLKNGLNEIRLTLRPESLGEVRMKIQVHEEVVVARINVESQQVKQIIESNLQNLKNALAEHNLQTGEFSVNVGNGSNGETAQSDGGSTPKGSSTDNPVTDGSLQETESAEPGTDTGRRYGTNTIEYFA
ncbi:MAG: hypothetical protein GF401_10415 [Chitinivibrionales bacterium]|nr:hypothetical protein [Chitinivibrionales bacterium]